MHTALSLDQLKHTYARLARHYDVEHALLTARSDQRGRVMLVEQAVREGDNVLDCGAGTGSTGVLAARKLGARGKLTLFDLSEQMLDVARDKLAEVKPDCSVAYLCGNMDKLPFADGSFDVVLSTYSLCPLTDPARGALEMYRVTRPGGLLGAAHSAEPSGRLVKAVADRVESLAWHFPSLSMGCRAVEVLPALEAAGAKLIFQRTIGVPLWPFEVFVARKPE